MAQTAQRFQANRYESQVAFSANNRGEKISGVRCSGKQKSTDESAVIFKLLFLCLWLLQLALLQFTANFLSDQQVMDDKFQYDRPLFNTSVNFNWTTENPILFVLKSISGNWLKIPDCVIAVCTVIPSST